MSEKQKLCVNCVHHVSFDYFNQCKRTISLYDEDPVTGWRESSMQHCRRQRESKKDYDCGPNARFYEEKLSLLNKLFGWLR